MGLISQDTYENLINEREELIQVKRPEVEQMIKEARAQGDLSENAEYHAAKDRQGEIESRIQEITALLNNSEVYGGGSDNSAHRVEIDGPVEIGNTVLVKDIDFDEIVEYKIVGSTESNPMKGLISNESPIGEALLGASKGETVTASTPSGDVPLEVLNIYKG